MRDTGFICVPRDAGIVCERRESVRAGGVSAYTAEVQNGGDSPVHIHEILSLVRTLPGDDFYVEYFESRWSGEFMPIRARACALTVRCTAGRSSAQAHPSFFITSREGKYLLAVTIGWSGNWRFTLTQREEGLEILCGMDDEALDIPLSPGASYVSPPVFVYAPPGGTLDEITAAFSALHRLERGVRAACALSMPVEWNHWWAYEDYAISENVFLENAHAAREMGFEACVLDAGWYGAPDVSWFEIRGDWDKVNRERFPHGIRFLSDQVHGMGMRFGLWCEIEALAPHADIVRERPELMARRNGKALNYLCMGTKAGRARAADTLTRLIEEYNLDWVKLDFNLDPGQGCDRAEHSHTGGDGLISHYEGYYSLLDEMRARFPDVIFENCSSGGQRVDLGILSHLHATFLSDNDETHNTMRFYRGAIPFLPPEALLRWSWSESRQDKNGNGPFPSFHAWDARYPAYERDFHLRAGMMGWLGFSHKLSEFDENTREVFKRHIAFYKEVVRPWLPVCTVRMPLHRGFREKEALYLFRMDAFGGCLLFVFAFEEQPEMILRLDALDDKRFYKVEDFDRERSFTASGGDLYTGLSLGRLRARESRIVRVLPAET